MIGIVDGKVGIDCLPSRRISAEYRPGSAPSEVSLPFWRDLEAQHIVKGIHKVSCHAIRDVGLSLVQT